MTVERILRSLAGFLVLLSLALAFGYSRLWLLMTAVVGVNLFQSGFTDWCPAMTLLRKLGFRDCRQ
ncbi:DUF2892 domain-containing protein [Pseudodesulfovibrio sp. F-1]|uniref:DUF2892 domain-containing protein n=1 Tax=Pseudodesulfovibrio alkaliphilus TaxID=2661613 RepID=A0A7K1KPC0_9BACT|nr:DUF2892 domain-containing protein [Pseudodesulfovibrio alkaliphilus]MUM77939.1 DUF2892 domain-containing protein [Pseudodesulfovibrio alkaliphilus]